MAFGKVLRRLRRERGLTQEQLGLEAELERNFISLIELGRNQPTLTTLFKLAKALDRTASYLIAQTEKEAHGS